MSPRVETFPLTTKPPSSWYFLKQLLILEIVDGTLSHYKILGLHNQPYILMSLSSHDLRPVPSCPGSCCVSDPLSLRPSSLADRLASRTRTTLERYEPDLSVKELGSCQGPLQDGLPGFPYWNNWEFRPLSQFGLRYSAVNVRSMTSLN